MIYLDVDGKTIKVPKGECYKGKAVNRMTDEQRAELGLFPVPAQEVPELTLEEHRQRMVVSPWQIRKALNQTGKRGQIESAMNSADQDTKDGWEYAREFERMNPLVLALGASLGMTETEIDDLFILAETL